jgi:hypothetical protein
MNIPDAILKLAIIISLVSIVGALNNLTEAVRTVELFPPCLIQAKELPK